MHVDEMGEGKQDSSRTSVMYFCHLIRKDGEMMTQFFALHDDDVDGVTGVTKWVGQIWVQVVLYSTLFGRIDIL